MIKVNLSGKGRKKSGMGVKIVLPTSFTPVLLVLIILGFGAGGYSWYDSLTSQSADLDTQKTVAEAQKAALEKVIKADEVYEARKKVLEERVKVIEGLQKNQVSPVLALDQLAEAVSKTNYVWLSTLDQKDAVLSMNGIGTSLNAIADFYSNLEATGYFKNLDLGPSADASGNWTFSLKCEFAPPRFAAPVVRTEAGGN
jgi:Tfp pilus assembly protein PilN